VKIGAGGLQTQVTHDDVASRQAQEVRKPNDLHKTGQDNDSAAALNKDALNKTVERLNNAAQSFDLPLRFVQKETEQGKKYVEMRHTATDQTKALEINEAVELINKIHESKGIVLDQYI